MRPVTRARTPAPRTGPPALKTACFPPENSPPDAKVNVREIRAHLRRELAGTGVDPADADLMAAEIATNAILHTASGRPGGRVWLTVIVSPERARIEITDQGGTPKEPQIPHSASLNGRGLLIVQELADRWGWTRDASGRTTVWFELPRTGETPP
ncbi:MAG: ATP-binding protein [Thermomonospora sp. CIF 1]|nr:MAG: ATP-binding protein [Thermomonospora sp. CIF 1]